MMRDDMSWWWFVLLLCCYLMLMCDSSADAGVLASTFVDLPTMTQAWFKQTVVGIAVKSTSYALHDDRANPT